MFIISKKVITGINNETIMKTLKSLRHDLYVELRKQYNNKSSIAHNKEKTDNINLPQRILTQIIT